METGTIRNQVTGCACLVLVVLLTGAYGTLLVRRRQTKWTTSSFVFLTITFVLAFLSGVSGVYFWGVWLRSPTV
ncbi:hypothetical protein KIPB_013024, partial [Kipferlia bialata]|eukprot:g13024.t1